VSAAPQTIFRIRRDYNAWVANETLEDYALRYTPRTFRKWSEFRVANTAFGAVSFLAMEAIGASIALNYGFQNALWAILLVGLITFLTGLPISCYAARYGVDMDLLTRGAGFGYLGSTLTSLIYASFTFLFFALEAAIMAQAVRLFFGMPIEWAYLLCSVVIVPLVLYGITLISRLQLWTQPLWLALLVCPYVAVLWTQPDTLANFTGLAGRVTGGSEFTLLGFGAAATVAFSLVVQIGEQVDFLRFLPEKTRANRRRWWAAVLLAGPGWILPGMLKMLGGAFLAYLALQHEVPVAHAMEPTQMYLAGFNQVFSDGRWALTAAALFVVVSQVKINVTNAYAGSLAWSNFFARLTHSHPGRVVWLVFNVLIAVLLMSLGVFQALEQVLGLYGNVAIAWVGALVADLVVNKPLGWSPRHIEFKRAHLYDINPVGCGATLLAAALAMVAYAGVLGPLAEAFSPLIALVTAFVASPVLARATGGRFYLARPVATAWKPGEPVRCTVCENAFESEDMACCPAYGGAICSLCCTLESRCHDRCKSRSRAAEQAQHALLALLPDWMSRRVNFLVGHYVLVVLSLCLLLATVLGVVYYQETLAATNAVGSADRLPQAFGKVFAMLAMIVAVCSWWVVLGSESRRMAQDESNRHNQMLTQEIDAHRRTDAALQAAKESAESANMAKTRYVAGMTHELRTPLNSILGYTQILMKDAQVRDHGGNHLATIQRSGEHLLALIDGLLDLARIEAGRLRLEAEPLPLAEAIDDIVRMVRPQAEAKGLDFHYVRSGAMPTWVRADAKRLRQILVNLLANAVRFTEQGSVTLRADCRREVVRLEVIDTGIGIAPEDHARIFLPFERSGGGRRAREPGTGLGLTITQLLTELMGGEVSLRSVPGQGSTFTVRLYLPETSAPPEGERRPYRPITGYLGPRRSLQVVDDQPVHRQLLAGMLMPLGFVVREAASGAECLESVRQAPVDAVLLDISMDGADGWQTARQLRAAGFAGPIVMVSANMFENQPERLRENGCQDFVGKPVIESELLHALERHLHLHWVTQPLEPRVSGWTAPDGPPAVRARRHGPPRLPVELASEMLRLARLGHLMGLRDALARLLEARPDLQPDCARLQQLVNRCDLDEVAALLKESIDVAQA